MKTFLFALGLGCGAAGFVLSVCNLAIDLAAWIKKRREEREEAEEKPNAGETGSSV